MSIINPKDNYSKVLRLNSDYSNSLEDLRHTVEASIENAQSVITKLVVLNSSYSERISALPLGSEKEADFNILDQERIDMAIGFHALLSRLETEPTPEELLTSKTALGL